MNKVSNDISKDLKDQPKFTTDIGEKDQDHHSFDLGEQTTLKKIQHFLHGNPTIVPVMSLTMLPDRSKDMTPSVPSLAYVLLPSPYYILN